MDAYDKYHNNGIMKAIPKDMRFDVRKSSVISTGCPKKNFPLAHF